MTTRSIRSDFVEIAAIGVSQDIHDLGLTVREAAEYIGISKSSLHNFMLAKHVRNHKRTLKALTAADIWSKETSVALTSLASYGKQPPKSLIRRITLVPDKRQVR